MAMLNIRISDAQKERLQLNANLADVTLSDYVRDLLGLRDERLNEIDRRLSALEASSDRRRTIDDLTPGEAERPFRLTFDE